MAQVWGPDTCRCSIEYEEVEDELTEVGTWVSTHNTCEAHQGLVGQALLDQCFAENRRRSHARYWAEMNYGLATWQTGRINSCLPTHPEFEENKSYFDAARNFHFIVRDRDGYELMTPQEKAQLEVWLDLHHGPGRTRVE